MKATVRRVPKRNNLPAHAKRRLEAFRQLMRDKAEAWNRLSAREKQVQRRKWKAFVKTLNESRGYRKVIVE